jgi:hypothetical protein
VNLQFSSVRIVSEQVPSAGRVESVRPEHAVQSARDVPPGVPRRLLHELPAVHQVLDRCQVRRALHVLQVHLPGDSCAL